LPDGGADHFYRCVVAVRQRTGTAVEVLTPDFLGDTRAIDRVLEARPEVYNHNLETVPRFYKKVRGRADYRRSLDLLAHVKRGAPALLSLWFAEAGDAVYEGDRLVEVLIGGATFDVAAPATGRLAEKRALPDDPLRPGQILGEVEVDGD